MPTDEKPTRSRSGSERRRRRHVKMIRFDDDELKTVEDAANSAGLAFASYGRAQMLGALPLRSVRRPPVEKVELAKVFGQLGKIGSNLNQIARAANTDGAADDDIRTAIAEVRAASQAVMELMGRRS